MPLADRLKQASHRDKDAQVGELAETNAQPQVYHDLKAELHRRLIDKIDLNTIDKLPREELLLELRSILASVVAGAEMPLNRSERERLIEELIDEVTGLGPLEPLLRDPTISDILVNGYSTVYIERRGKLEPTSIRFRDNAHVQHIINRIVARVGRRIDETSPMVDARLADGSRVNAIIPPLAIDGPTVSIRRFGTTPLKVRELVGIGAMSKEMVGFLAACIRSKLNLLISGGTGTGKTTMLNALSHFIPEDERIITIEDAAELQLQQRHVVRLETRPPNIEGRGEVVARDLVRNSLRMRPDRIIVGEVRGAEVLDMLQAMNTGHEGSMATVHANSPRDALSRIEAMLGMSGVPLSEASMRQMVSRAINIIVHLTRGVDGHRRVTSVMEVTGTESSVITMQELLKFDQRGIDQGGHVLGEFISTDIRPKARERIERFGVDPVAIIKSLFGS